MSAKNIKHDILSDPEFVELSGKKNSISISLAILELAAYFGFIFLIAFGKLFLAGDISENVTVGIPIGVGVIILSWVLTGIYVRWANSTYDTLVEKVKTKIGG